MCKKLVKHIKPYGSLTATDWHYRLSSEYHVVRILSFDGDAYTTKMIEHENTFNGGIDYVVAQLNRADETSNIYWGHS